MINSELELTAGQFSLETSASSDEYLQDVLDFEDGWKKLRFDIFEINKRPKFPKDHYLNNYLPKIV